MKMFRKNPGEIFRISPDIGPVNPSLTLKNPLPFRGLKVGVQNNTFGSSNPLKFSSGHIEIGPLVLGLQITSRWPYRMP